MDALRAVVRAIHRSGPAVERGIGISGAQLFALQQLGSAPAASVGELAERIGTHQSSASTVLAQLAARGLVERRTGTHDARRTEIAITEAGRALLAAAPATAQSRMMDALRGMPPDQLHRLADALDALVRKAGFSTARVPLFLEDDRVPET
jgi:DNA-binding MarR family transcriptional regulator